MKKHLRYSLALLCTTFFVASGCSPSSKSSQHPQDSQASKEIVRKSQDAPPPGAPELPSNADRLPEITVKISDPDGATRIVSRTKDRVHLAMPARKQEWLFIRNPVDGRRVSGILIDHNHKVRIDYPEVDLRIEGVARGWADVIAVDESNGEVTPGVDQSLLQDPRKRFPNYGDFDIADWREELHENGHDHAGHHPESHNENETSPAHVGH